MWRVENDEDSAAGAVFVCRENLSTRLDDVLLRTYDAPMADCIAEALNVFNETGLTPRGLIEALRTIRGTTTDNCAWSVASRALGKGI